MPPRQQTFTQEERDQFIAQGVAAALATRNQTRPCTFRDFQRCEPPNFSGTEGALGLIRWIERIESIFRIINCPDNCKVLYATNSFQDNALTWWTCHTRAVGMDTAYGLSWEELKRILRDNYCPSEVLHKLEDELWNLTVKDNDIMAYTNRFQQLAHLCTSLVNPESQRIERYIGGLPLQIEGMVTASKPTTFDDAVRMAHRLIAQVVRRGTPVTESNQGNRNENSSPSHDPIEQPEPLRSYYTEPNERRGYGGNLPFCHGCKRHHNGPCGLPCERCQKYGHTILNCRVPANPNSQRVCFKCKEPGHYKKDCPKRKRRIDSE